MNLFISYFMIYSIKIIYTMSVLQLWSENNDVPYNFNFVSETKHNKKNGYLMKTDNVIPPNTEFLFDYIGQRYTIESYSENGNEFFISINTIGFKLPTFNDILYLIDNYIDKYNIFKVQIKCKVNLVQYPKDTLFLYERDIYDNNYYITYEYIEFLKSIFDIDQIQFYHNCIYYDYQSVLNGIYYGYRTKNKKSKNKKNRNISSIQNRQLQITNTENEDEIQNNNHGSVNKIFDNTIISSEIIDIFNKYIYLNSSRKLLCYDPNFKIKNKMIGRFVNNLINSLLNDIVNETIYDINYIVTKKVIEYKTKNVFYVIESNYQFIDNDIDVNDDINKPSEYKIGIKIHYFNYYDYILNKLSSLIIRYFYQINNRKSKRKYKKRIYNSLNKFSFYSSSSLLILSFAIGTGYFVIKFI